MAKLWTPPPTFTAGPKLRVGDVNTYARDNLAVLRERPGAIANYTDITDRPAALDALAVGWVTVPLNSERRDSGGIHNNEQSISRLTAPAESPGLYLVTGHAQLLYDAPGPGVGAFRTIGIRANGDHLLALDNTFRTLTATQGQTVAVLALLSPREYVELVTFHDSNNKVVVCNSGDPLSPELRMQFLCEVRPSSTAPTWKGLKTWADDEVLTHGDLNDQLRDNPSFLRYRPMAMLAEIATQAITSGSWNTLNLGTTLAQNGIWNGTANQLTVPAGAGGLYLIAGHGDLNGATGGTVRRLGILHSSGNRILVKSFPGFGAEAAYPKWAVARLFRLAAGDTLKLQMFQDSGGNVPTENGNTLVGLAACWMAP